MRRIATIIIMACLVWLGVLVTSAHAQNKQGLVNSPSAEQADQLNTSQDLMRQLDELAQLENVLKQEERRFREHQQSRADAIKIALAENSSSADATATKAAPVPAEPVKDQGKMPEPVSKVVSPVPSEAAGVSDKSVKEPGQNFGPRDDKPQEKAGKPEQVKAAKTCVTKDCQKVEAAKVVKTTAPAVPQDYWNTTLNQQTVEEIERHLQIDSSYKQAKGIVLPQTPYKKGEGEATPTIVMPVEILRSLIKSENLQQKIDLAFDDTSLSDIVMILGDAGKVNIVMDPVLKNSKLDLHLKQVTVEDALLLMSNSYDLGFKAVGDSLYITKQDKLREQNILSRVFKLKNIKAEEAKAMMKDLVKTVNISGEINSLIVVGQPEDIIRVEKVLNSIDHPQPQVVLEARIVEVNKDALRDLGVDWADQLNMQFQESGRPQDFANVEDAPGSPFKLYAMSRSPLQFENMIKVLETQNKAKVLSNPRVTTLNDKEAEIFVGDRIPYTVTTISGGVATSDVRFEEPGIRLTITPSIIGDDFVVIKVEPEVSYIFSFRGPNDQYPWVKKRQATAYVRVKNNQPFVLGGLLNQEDKHNLSKIPLLGNMPLLGNLFSYDKKTVQDTELIITITPTIVYEASN